MRQEHNQAHRTPPVPHSGSLCAPSSRVPKPRFSAPETVRGPRGKKNCHRDWPEPGRSELKNGSVSLGFVCCARFESAVFRAWQAALPHLSLARRTTFVRRLYSRCRSSVQQVALVAHVHPSRSPSRYIYFLSGHR